MSELFDAAVAFVLEQEGGYNPNTDGHDRGGETNFGISASVYSNINIRKLTRDSAISIYHRDYWTRILGDALPRELTIVMFDCAVNQGVGTAIRLLQEALHVTVDGKFGPQTMRALRAANPAEVALSFCVRRAWRYEINRQEERYGLSWFRRLFEGYRAALLPM